MFVCVCVMGVSCSCSTSPESGQYYLKRMKYVVQRMRGDWTKRVQERVDDSINDLLVFFKYLYCLRIEVGALDFNNNKNNYN